MANPHPVQSEEFLAKRFQPATDIPKSVKLAKKPRCVKLPIKVDAIFEDMDPKTRSAWLRQAICAAAIEQGLIDAID